MTDETNPLVRDKWVRVMTDYSSDGLWAKDGGGVGADDLPVTAAIKQRLSAWCENYEQSEFYLPADKRERQFDVAAHASEGLAIAKAIKLELPDWTVVYFDEAKSEERLSSDSERSEFEYEVQ